MCIRWSVWCRGSMTHWCFSPFHCSSVSSSKIRWVWPVVTRIVTVTHISLYTFLIALQFTSLVRSINECCDFKGTKSSCCSYIFQQNMKFIMNFLSFLDRFLCSLVSGITDPFKLCLTKSLTVNVKNKYKNIYVIYTRMH